MADEAILWRQAWDREQSMRAGKLADLAFLVTPWGCLFDPR